MFVLYTICVIDVHSVTIYDARLTGGLAGYEGTVEVLTYHGWLPMCYTYAELPDYVYDAHEYSLYTWDRHTESKVLCRQLGYDVTYTPCKLNTMILFDLHEAP